DAIEAAGGATEQAQLDALNLAAVASDGDYILVPNREADGSNVGYDSPAATQGSADVGTGMGNNNTADTAAVEKLPGLGLAHAEQNNAHQATAGDVTYIAKMEGDTGNGPVK